MDRALIKGHAPASIPAAVAGDFIPPGRVSRSYYILCLLLISKANKRSGSSRGSFFMQVFARVVLHSSRGSFFIQVYTRGSSASQPVGVTAQARRSPGSLATATRCADLLSSRWASGGGPRS